jgi:hypothetical protein
MKKMSMTNSSMQHGIWAKPGAEQSRFPFTGNPGIDVDLEDPSNSLEYFVLYTRNYRNNSQRNKSVCPKIFRKHA